MSKTLGEFSGTIIIIDEAAEITPDVWERLLDKDEDECEKGRSS